MTEKSLESLLQTTTPVKLLRNSKIGAHVYPVVQAEYTNCAMNNGRGSTPAFCLTSRIT